VVGVADVGEIMCSHRVKDWRWGVIIYGVHISYNIYTTLGHFPGGGTPPLDIPKGDYTFEYMFK
jgi:hypothetical protein